MSQHRCPLCSIEPCHAAGSLLAFAAHPRLADRLSAVLHEAKIRHTRDDRLLTIQADGPEWRRMVVALLHDSLSTVEQKLVRIEKATIASIFGAPDLATFSDIVNTEWFDRALAADQFSMYYQPIIDVQTGRAFAYECLIRLEADRIYSGAEIVSAATLRRDVLTFDNYARGKAIRSASAEPRNGTKLFINFFPSAMFDPEPCLESTIETIRESSLDPGDIVFEIIECDQITNPDHTRKICEYFRRHGFHYAIDDLGVGTNSLEMIEILRPDFIKIDKSLIWNLSDPECLETVRLAIGLARRVGSEIIAEGVESPRLAADVRRLGIHMMQGYCFGKPAPVMREETNQELVRDLMRLSTAVISSSDHYHQTVPAPVSASRTPGIPS